MNEELKNIEEELEEVLDEYCSAGYVEDDGREFKCRRRNYWSEKEQKFWEHPGGHMYMTNKGSETLKFKEENGWHFDNKALLSLQPAASHAPEDCTRTGFCWWRTDKDI